LKELKDKNCFLTGAASGIGRSFALALAREGMNLFITDINMEKLNKVRDEVQSIGATVFIGKCDVSSCEDFEENAKEFHSKLGDLDFLINNAGIAIGGVLTEFELEDWQEVLDVNLWSVINSLKTFLPHMIKRKSGHIINVASAAGVLGLTEPLPYVTSKFAVVGLSEALYGQLHRLGINVSVILPSYIRTNIFESSKMKYPEKLIQEIGLEKTNQITQTIMDEYLRSASSPDRVVKRYIKNIKQNRLYISNTSAILPMMALKGTSPLQYEEFLKKASLDYFDHLKNIFLEYGVNIEDYRGKGF